MQYNPQCIFCKHYNFDTGDTCKAYPERIPNGILTNSLDHRKSLPNDGGVRWEPDEDGIQHPGVANIPEEDLA